MNCIARSTQTTQSMKWKENEKKLRQVHACNHMAIAVQPEMSTGRRWRLNINSRKRRRKKNPQKIVYKFCFFSQHSLTSLFLPVSFCLTLNCRFAFSGRNVSERRYIWTWNKTKRDEERKKRKKKAESRTSAISPRVWKTYECRELLAIALLFAVSRNSIFFLSFFCFSILFDAIYRGWWLLCSLFLLLDNGHWTFCGDRKQTSNARSVQMVEHIVIDRNAKVHRFFFSRF